MSKPQRRTFTKQVTVKATDDAEQLSTGTVLTPYELDHQLDWLAPTGIEAMHNPDPDNGVLHARFPEGDAEIIANDVLDRAETIDGVAFDAGDWVIRRKYHDDELWSLVADGILNGYSIGGEVSEVIEYDSLEALPNEVAIPAAVDPNAVDERHWPPTQITNGFVSEISDVDVPAVASATYAVAKADAAKTLVDDVTDIEEFIAAMNDRGHSADDARRLWSYLQTSKHHPTPSQHDMTTNRHPLTKQVRVRDPGDVQYETAQAGGPDWDRPALEEFDSLADAGTAFLASETGFPPDQYQDLSYPVVTAEGTLRQDALDSAWRTAGQGTSDDVARQLRTTIRTLVDREWPDSDLAARIDDWFDETEQTAMSSDTDSNPTKQLDADDVGTLKRFASGLTSAFGHDRDDTAEGKTHGETETVVTKDGRSLNTQNRRYLYAAHDAIESTLSSGPDDFRMNRFSDNSSYDFDLGEFGADADGGKALDDPTAFAKAFVDGETEITDTTTMTTTDSEEAPEWAKHLQDDVEQISDRVKDLEDDDAATSIEDAPEWAQDLSKQIETLDERVDKVSQATAGTDQLGSVADDDESSATKAAIETEQEVFTR